MSKCIAVFIAVVVLNSCNNRSSSVTAHGPADGLGFRPGDHYCFVVDSVTEGWYPDDYMGYRDFIEAMRAKDMYGISKPRFRGIHVVRGDQIVVLETGVLETGGRDSPYTKARIIRLGERSAADRGAENSSETVYRHGTLGQVLYTMPLAEIWEPCR